MKVLATIAQFFIFLNAMKGEWRCLSESINGHLQKRRRKAAEKTHADGGFVLF
jgi:hypothetical protein